MLKKICIISAAMFIATSLNCNAQIFKSESIISKDWHARTIAKPTTLRSANGINIDSNDNLYVASVLERTITVLNPRNGKVIEKLGPEQGVDTPDDLTFAPDGTLYWTAFMTGQVRSMNLEGETSTLAQLEPGVNAITMSDDGRLFVTRVFLGDQLYEIDPQGVEPPRLVAEDMGGLNGMDFGPDGFLYGPLWFKGEVARVNVDTGEISTVLSGLHTPAAVKFDHTGFLHVLDQHTGEIIQFNLETEEQRVIAESEIGIDNLAFNSKNRLFMTSAHDGSVVELLPSGQLRKVVAGGLTSPGGIVVKDDFPHQSIYVSDTYSLQQLDGNTGQTISVVHSIVGDVTGVATPLSIARFEEQFVTTSWFAGTVQLYDYETDTVTQTWLDFSVPLYATGFHGDLLVAELGTHSVVMRPEGTVDRLVVTDQLYVPAGIAVFGNDAWVSDWATGIVWQIIEDGNILASPAPVATELNHPEGIVVYENSLFVVEAGSGTVTQINLATGEKYTVIENLPIGITAPTGYPPTWMFNGIDVDTSGRLFVPLDKTGEICILTPKP